MEGEMQRKTRSKASQKPEKTEKQTVEDEDNAIEHEEEDTLQTSIGAIYAEIKAIRSDVKTELNNFHEILSRDMKADLANFKTDINMKLNEITTDLNYTMGRLEQAEQRVTDLKEWNTEAKEVLCQTLDIQQKMQTKLTDLEARSRRNNIRLYRIPEESEGDNIQEFIESFIKAELALPDTELGIQRCHRALCPKPPPNANPRSIVIYFLEYKIKELVLRSAWRKREVHLKGRRVYFDQDYPAETQKKRKAFAPIRKLLKEKGLRFQTPPPAKLRIFFEDGPVVYSNAAEAMEDLKKKGLTTASIREDRATVSASMERLSKISWETAGARPRRSRETHRERARKRLQDFRRDIGDTD
ncbi:LINE-1 type transposase domain-containing 1 [Labeo rohita]|uniref:LINE-1 type transposase domain-containing 1 n=1 Tax=Labeo rohita TaxID=84645 RepID=A0A498LRW7_LABRO|nr:LINE-1 type transposase domain-containing 1 [Labeo rohita]